MRVGEKGKTDGDEEWGEDWQEKARRQNRSQWEEYLDLAEVLGLGRLQRIYVG